MASLYPEFGLDKMGRCEIGRVAISLEHRSKSLWYKLVAMLSARALLKNCPYLFTISSLEQAQQNQATHIKMGFQYVIDESIQVPLKEVYLPLGRIYLAHSHMSIDLFTAFDQLM